ncbi:hypothetical protein chiPu_0027595 [Chiloscyllium punctatum]|uniref:Immunoglobulin I-set domain-containing protein n=1 Tax=Chiloscyllium punctatum TaxID=137246 RepID=A0A401TLI2_CHIPU|nr:hypothetical protein [Chiloscyllium punctatum]
MRGNPRPGIQWIYEGSVLTEGPISWTAFYEETSNEIHGCLELASPTHCNNGEYTLVVSNPLGSDRRSARGYFMEGPIDICLTEPTKPGSGMHSKIPLPPLPPPASLPELPTQLDSTF